MFRHIGLCLLPKIMHEHNSEKPDALWYVVNHMREKSPSMCRLARIENIADVEDFKDGYDGLIIDTSILFKLLMDVTAGVRTKDDIRTLLMTSQGILPYPE